MSHLATKVPPIRTNKQKGTEMLIKTITIESVDLELLHNQRRDLEKVMRLDGITEPQQDNLEGLLILLDYICDKYEVLTYSTEEGE